MDKLIEIVSLHKETDRVSIGDDLVLFENPKIPLAFDHPFKLNVVVATICIKGSVKGAINLKPFIAQSPCLIAVLPGQILQYESISEDFSGLFILMSKRFSESLDMQNKIPLFLSAQDNTSFPLEEISLEAMKDYYHMLKRIVRQTEHPYRMEVAKHLTMALFYGLGYLYHTSSGKEKKTKHEIMAERFLQLIQANYKKQRNLDFYADKLCLTPKYLSKVIKENSGLSANDWIDNYVVLEAKALLKSTNMTIQQISDELDFPSQSFFGKYFKRCTGVSPSDYKKGSE
jgi:AraC-like DNA-binding protein